MKLRQIKIFAMGLIVTAIAITQYGCEKDWQKEFASATLLDAATATVSVSAIKDSSAMLTYSTSAVGRVFVAVIPADKAAPSAATMIILKAPSSVFSKQFVFTDAATLSGTVEITGIKQFTTYKVYVLPVNADGVQGTILTKEFKTSDTYPPTLLGKSPSVSSSASQVVDFKAVLTFSETVVLAETFDIKMGYFNTITGDINYFDVPADKISVASSVVTISQPHVALYGQYVFLSIGAGSFTDVTGNEYEGIVSEIDADDELVGLYWRVKNALITPEVIQTDSITSDLGLTIVLDYPDTMVVSSSYDPSMIVVRYTIGGTKTEVQVPKANLEIVNDTLLEISLPRTPDYGESITFEMKEGVVKSNYGNASSAINFNFEAWFISYGYTQSLIVSPYIVSRVSNTGAAMSDVQAEVIDDPESTDDANVLLNGITKNIFGLAEEAPITAVFDGDLATISAVDWQPLFKTTLGGKLGTVYFSSRFGEAAIVGQIAADGSFNLDGWGYYFLSDDETVYGWAATRYNTTTWTQGTIVVKSSGVKGYDFVLDSKSEKRIRK